MSCDGQPRSAACANAAQLLESVIREVGARARSERPVVVLDLDSTILDNRPRTLAIVRDLERSWSAPAPADAKLLGAISLETLRFRVQDTLQLVGIRNRALIDAAILSWRNRFFSNELLHLDRPYPGAVGFAKRCHAAGATIVYLTARDLNAMGRGTVESLLAHGFPFGLPRVELVMKPSAGMADNAYKREMAPELGRIGRVVAAFDNEPHHCNTLKDAFPEATVCLVSTQHSPSAPIIRDSVVVIQGFEGAA